MSIEDVKAELGSILSDAASKVANLAARIDDERGADYVLMEADENGARVAGMLLEWNAERGVK